VWVWQIVRSRTGAEGEKTEGIRLCAGSASARRGDSVIRRLYDPEETTAQALNPGRKFDRKREKGRNPPR